MQTLRKSEQIAPFSNTFSNGICNTPQRKSSDYSLRINYTPLSQIRPRKFLPPKKNPRCDLITVRFCIQEVLLAILRIHAKTCTKGDVNFKVRLTEFFQNAKKLPLEVIWKYKVNTRFENNNENCSARLPVTSVEFRFTEQFQVW